MKSSPKPKPTAINMMKCPHEIPRAWGNVARTPKFTPEVNNIMLFGPGVTDDTKANTAMDTQNST
jgi:hypothetical protein